MDMNLQGKTALVFGAGGGLGGAIASALAAEGARVAAADINDEAVRETCRNIEAAGGQAMALEWDMTRPDALEANMARIEDRYGAVQVLINNTGGPPPTPAAGQSAADWEKYFHAMVLSVIAVTDRVLPGMKSAGYGRIVTSASSGVITPIPNLAISNALRLALVGWSKTLAREVGQHGITANIIVPGRIATPRITFLDEQKAAREQRSVQDVMRESTQSIPLGRYGKPEEYAKAAVFLASGAASYITGSILRVDGGLIPSV